MARKNLQTIRTTADLSDFERRFRRVAGSGRVVVASLISAQVFTTKSAPALPEFLDDAKVRDSPADH